MVTIEQKLTLFSKLLSQELKEEVSQKTMELEKEYEGKIAESKYKIDRQVADIIDNARKRAEAKKIELISKGKMSSKKEIMLTTEKVVVRFIEALIDRARKFVDKPVYETYLRHTVDQLDELRDYTNPLVIYMQQKDITKYRGFIEEELIKIGVQKEQLQFEEAESDIIGGLIIADPTLNMKIDMSMRSVIEESKDRIVEIVTGALGEVGEGDE
ncbi:V-type ATP synthase subunit E [Cellulosilyticum ruminicola]|uniref:V-type ATP synthase subunit E n=1 Tax=Cellulosilyticum ruminicola TaxID=425254 RepID=UPI0006D06219|nr:V-type ATP synthase subunit E family protein [Cellulosilyticum ruminicola]